MASPRPVLVLELSSGTSRNDALIRRAIGYANEKQPSYSAVLPQHVWLVPPSSLPRTVKGGVQRAVVEGWLRTGDLQQRTGVMRLEEEEEKRRMVMAALPSILWR